MQLSDLFHPRTVALFQRWSTMPQPADPFAVDADRDLALLVLGVVDMSGSAGRRLPHYEGEFGTDAPGPTVIDRLVAAGLIEPHDAARADVQYPHPPRFIPGKWYVLTPEGAVYLVLRRLAAAAIESLTAAGFTLVDRPEDQ